jgi:uncharacterized protein
MNYIERNINLSAILKKKSAFLLGPRQTGKTSVIKNQLKEYKTINLLINETFLKFSQNKSELRERVTPEDKIVIIDEIQRLPELLNDVQYLIEEYGTKFLLTGSSARKLRRQGVNLLGGRARQYFMHPFSYSELKDDFDLLKALNRGLIPSIYDSDDPIHDLSSYIGLYLKEEIVAEALTRKIDAFSRFLQVAALSNGQLVNHTNISNDAQVPRTTVIEYFGVLIDTLFATYLEPWKKTKKRKSLSTSKFYFFDNGIIGQLQERGKIKKKSPAFGEAFETYIYHELKSYIDCTSPRPLNYWRSTSHFEVDFIFDNRIAIEVKGKAQISQKDLSGLRAIREEDILEEYIVVCLETEEKRTSDGITILPWELFITKLWSGGWS